MGYKADQDQHGYTRPNTLRVTVRQSHSETRRGLDDVRTERKWLYVRLPPRVFHKCGLERGDVAEVTLYFPAGAAFDSGVINIRREGPATLVMDDE